MIKKRIGHDQSENYLFLRFLSPIEPNTLMMKPVKPNPGAIPVLGKVFTD